MGGITLLQLREKDKSTREYIDLAEKVHTLTKKYNVPLIIDDRVDVALAIDAEGVHVGQSDMPVSTARKLIGDDKIVGATTKTVPQALEAYEKGADYLGVGAIYPTTTKVKTVLTSTETLGNICSLRVCLFRFLLICGSLSASHWNTPQILVPSSRSCIAHRCGA